MLNVATNPFMLNVATNPYMLSVVMLNVGMLNVGAPTLESIQYVKKDCKIAIRHFLQA